MPDPADIEAYDATLYGRDRTERIVGLHLVQGAGGERMRVYRRTGATTVEHADEPFYPFFFLSDIELLRAFPRERFRFQELEGDGFFRFLVVFPDRSGYWDAMRHVERVTETNAKRPAEIYFPGSPEQQYLMQTGRTLFKGMPFEDLYRLQLDIETYASEGGFPNAERADDRVIIVSLSDNRGWTRLIDVNSVPEKVLLQEVVRLIREKNPDVIEGHNCYAFDFPYLMTRCARYGVPFAIGRDGSVPRSFPSSMRFAERSVDFPALDIAGRHVIDTYFQVMSFDVFKRDLPGYGLKAAAKYFGFAPEDRTYVPGAEIPRVWDEDPQRLLAYALDDVIETERLSRHLSGSTFYLTQMVPMPYDQCARTGPASKIEALFVREYLRQRRALPRSDWGSQVVGGYTDVFVTGVVGPVVYADVESLYPSIMLNYDVQPKDDTLGLFPSLLRTLTDLRLETKAQMRTADTDEERGELDARQSAYKVVINCFTPDTDVMTADGLKRIEEVDVGDLVYAIDPKTFAVAYRPVTRTYRQERYAGPLVRIENAFVDYAVTPNHRMLTAVQPAGRDARPYTWRDAADLFADKHRHRLPPNAPFSGGVQRHAVSLREECDRLGLPYRYDAEGDRIKDPRQQAKWIPNTYRMVDWLQFAGWFVSEGSVYTSSRRDYGYTVRGESSRVQIANKTPDEREAIRALLNRMGLTASESANGFAVANRILADVLTADFGNGSACKRLPDWIWNLGGRLLRNLLRTAYLGDGNKSARRYNTKSRRLADDFVRLAFHCGYRARVTGEDSGCWRVAFYDRSRGVRPVVKSDHRRCEPYTGALVCLEVAEHHTVLAGRDGKLNWCGQSFYGNMGFGMAIFNDFAEADRVARTGQELLRRIIRAIRERGGTVVEVDTDGVLFVPPDGVRGETDERAFVASLSDAMPEGIRIGFDGRFQKMLSYKKKNYALLGYDGKLKFKGSSLVSRSSERFGRRFVREAVALLLDEDIQGLHDLYLRTRDAIVNHDWRSVQSFQRTETLKDTVDQYRADVEAGKRTRAASYELAIARSEATGQPVTKGDRISYYVTGTTANVTAFENAKLADEWDPAAPDENTAYYLKRLDEFAAKFTPFFRSDHDFRLVFSPEDLFGFDPTGITLQRTERAPDEVEDDVPF
jgi:DNA polymerase elongation subunit (family B)